MKIAYWLLGGLVGSLLAISGCSKSAQKAPDSIDYNGVQVSWPKLDLEFAGAPQDMQVDLSEAKRAFRYGLFAQAIPALEKLAKYPNLTPAQQKLLNEVLEQTKQVIAKGPPAGQ